jgi:putative ABC transport system permease protein
MKLQIAPIIATLRRHKIAAFLIGTEIALACAVLCNACFLVSSRIAMMRIDSGVEEASLATLHLTAVEPAAANDVNARVLEGLRGVAGVQAVSLINAVPFGQRVGNAGITLDAEDQHTAGVVHFYVGSPGAMEMLGLKLIEGRRFEADDFHEVTTFLPAMPANVIITRTLAEHLWPGHKALGQTFYCDGKMLRVIGVVAHFAQPDPDGRGIETGQWSVLAAGKPGPKLVGNYLIRADPAQLPRVLREAKSVVTALVPDAVLDEETSKTVSQLRMEYFRQDRAMTGMLLGVIVGMLLVTALGIVGLASFWVQQRRRQIGIRRAVGATRGDILRYFQTENFLIVSGGIVAGMVLAYALNIVLMQRYELPRLPLFYLPVGALALWTLGQLAVLAPALRAAAIAPVVAMRSS